MERRNKSELIPVIAASFLIFLYACTPPQTPAPSCTSDSDCVPADCCHSASCIPASQKPSCEEVVCTMECVPGTLDCGGSCACQNGKCVGRNYYSE